MKHTTILKSIIAILFITLAASLTPVQAQDAVKFTEPDKIYTQADQMPVYKSGMAAQIKFVQKNVKRPKGENLSGIVRISFIVNEEGNLSDFQVVQGLAPALDEEAIRVVKLTDGDWKPGTQNGTPVKVRFTVPVIFK